MCTASRRAPRAPITSRSRSWVSGRAGRTPCCSKAIAEASTAPIQIGRYRSPSASLSSTIGWFTGSSTRTPTTRSSFTLAASPTPDLPDRRYTVPVDGAVGWVGRGAPVQPPSSARSPARVCRRPSRPAYLDGPKSAAELGAQPGPDERRVQPDRQRGELADGLLGAAARLGVALAHQRRDDLLEEADLPIRGGPVRPQVPRLDAEAGHLGGAGRDGERVPVVRPALAATGQQAVLLELVELLGVEPGGGEQLVAGQAHLGRLRPERVRTRQRLGGDQRTRPAPGRRSRPALGWLNAAVDRIEMLLDHPQREVVVALLGQHEPQPGDVSGGELPVSGGGALGMDQPLRLEEADLRDRDVRELRAQLAEDLADAQRRPGVRSRGAHRVAAGSSPPVRAPAR